MTKKEDQSSEKSEWDNVSFEPIKTAEQIQVEETPKKSYGKKKNEPLSLDESGVPQTKTRTEMAKDITNGDELEDLIDTAPIALRGLAGLLDYAFIFGLYKFSILVNPFLRSLTQYFLDKYDLKFIFSEPVVLNIIWGVDLMILSFFLIIIPMAFYNVTVGKLMFGLRVRSLDKYSISITQSFQREFIFKPLSTASIVGLVWAFFSKERRTLHDKAAQTIVVRK